MEKKKTLDVRISNMNLVPKWAFLAVKLKKKVDLENEAHFEVFFQIYPSMLETFTGALTILTLVVSWKKKFAEIRDVARALVRFW